MADVEILIGRRDVVAVEGPVTGGLKPRRSKRGSIRQLSVVRSMIWRQNSWRSFPVRAGDSPVAAATSATNSAVLVLPLAFGLGGVAGPARRGQNEAREGSQGDRSGAERVSDGEGGPGSSGKFPRTCG